jgi:RING/Ubox like zinc-binding domain
MWCWHKIRESENGLCPACRTPYGEDPHQFTALDVEEVLKAKKEAQVAAKRERHSHHQSQHNQGNNHNHSNSVGASGTAAVTTMATGTDAASTSGDTADGVGIEGPKDRSQLANLRVIRRNLIYVVGLPPSIANEEMLRRPEYFGQYGKLAKVVFNRSQMIPGDGGDPRRASSSAYITFQYNEDTLACILALDGFYLDNRTIRASYGTSKYCSAFIKHVRCSNPDCTYLHEMGATEDTFTKQEIQAGYVTSGRDVLARQQQILQEQLKQQLVTATVGHHLPARKRVGGGGPSGTGKACTNPTFPAPEYDEPVKQAPPLLPSAAGILRSSTIGNPLSSSTMQPSVMNAGNIPAKLGRASSAGVSPGVSGSSPLLGASTPTRKTQSSISATQIPAVTAAAGHIATTAASVVASGRTAAKDNSDGVHPHSTLTALTPLKRSSVKGGISATNPKLPPVVTDEKGPAIRNGKKQNGTSRAVQIAPVVTTNNKSSSTFDSAAQSPLAVSEASSDLQSSAIGGDVIGLPVRTIGSSNGGATVGPGRHISIPTNYGSGGLAELGGLPVPTPVSGGETANNRNSGTAASVTILGGDVFTGSLLTQNGNNKSTIVGGSSLLGGSLLVPSGNDFSSSSIVGGDIGLRIGTGNANPWAGGGPMLGSSSVSSNGVIGAHISNQGVNSSSALASILGINLPTGSGSLQETSSLWSLTPQQPPQQQGPSPLSMLNESTLQENQYYRQQSGMGVQLRTVGPSQPSSQTPLIGGLPIRSSGISGLNDPGTIGGSSTVGGGSRTDIALLQSLLPGVHITTDHSSTIGWGAVATSHGQSQNLVVGGSTAGIVGGGSWVGAGDVGNKTFASPSSGRAPLSGGVIGQNHAQHQNSNQGPGIW